MSKIENSINILGTIAPLNTEDTYPTHWAKYGKGGYVSVPNKEDIPISRLENGMRIYETSTNKEWLVSGDENGYTYIEYIVSGGDTISRESNVQNLSSNITLSSSSDYFQFLNPTTNGYRVTLPATISTDFFEFEIINTSSSFNFDIYENSGVVAEISLGPTTNERYRAVYCMWNGVEWAIWIRAFYQP